MSNQDENIDIEVIAEQWVNLILSTIEANRQKEIAPLTDNKRRE